MSLYSVLNLAQGGLLAQQAGISVTSENINGVGLPGYSRRSAQLDAFLRTKGVAGGVHYAGTERAFDAITYRRLVGEVGLLGAADARATALAQTESIVAPGDGSIGQQIGDLFAAFDALALKADDPTARTQVLFKAESLAQTFRETAGGLATQRQEMLTQAQGIASQVNDMLSSIAELNRRIVENQQSDGARAEMMDQRDQLTREVGNLIGVNVVQEESGAITLLSSGSSLVEGSRAAQVNVTQNTNGDLQIEFAKGSTTTDVTSKVDGGQLGGLREARDIDIVGMQADLDLFAAEFAAQMNAVHSAGFGLDGVSGRPLFTGANGTPLPAPPGTAYALSVNPLLQGNPDAVAASSDINQLPGGNDIAVAIAQLADAVLPSGGTPSERFGAFAGKIGTLVSGANSELTLRQGTVQHTDSVRESHSGVSLDEEMVSLTRYQRAYEASLRVLKAADEMLTELTQRL